MDEETLTDRDSSALEEWWSVPDRTEAYPALLDQLAHAGVQAVSFDVFDTVLTRKIGEPSMLFLQLGSDLVSRGLVPCTPETFMRLRIAADERARKNFPGREITLREIYTEMVFSQNLDDILEQLIEAELDAERHSIVSIPRMRATVDLVRRQFGRVLYISDMYLPEEFLEDRLRAFGLFHATDRLYVSSSHGGGKVTGALFRTVLDHEDLCPERLLHCGNSREADVLAATRVGLKTHHFHCANPNASEEILNLHALRSEGLTAQLAGTSRRLRLQGSHLDAAEAVVWDTAVSLTGPLVLMYAHWIIERAAAKGVKELLFLARDAYLPCMAVRTLLSARASPNLAVHYVHGSRATYRPLAIEALGKREWKTLAGTVPIPGTTIEDLRRTLMASESTFAEHLPPLGFPPDMWERPLAASDLARIKRHALEDRNFNHALLADLMVFQQRTRRFLKHRGLTGAGAIAVVDTGWSTKSHAPLIRFLRRESGRPVRLFYLGLDVDQPEVRLDSVDTFLYNSACGCGARVRPFEYARALETLLMAGHGRTIGFEEHDDVVKPVLGPVENREFIGDLFPLYERGVVSFVELAAPILQSASAFHDLRHVANQLIHEFWAHPTADVAAVWAPLRWEYDINGKITHLLARPYGYCDLWRAFVQNRFPLCHDQFWWEGALALTPKRKRLALEATICVRRVLARLIRLAPAGVVRGARRLNARAQARAQTRLAA